MPIKALVMPAHLAMEPDDFALAQEGTCHNRNCSTYTGPRTYPRTEQNTVRHFVQAKSIDIHTTLYEGLRPRIKFKV